MIGLMVVLLMSFSRMVSIVLVLQGFKEKNYSALLQASEMTAELHSRNLILVVNSFMISIHIERVTVA